MYTNKRTLATPSSGRPLGRALLVLLALLFAAGGATAAVCYLRRTLRNSLFDVPLTRLASRQIEVTPVPSWITENVPQRVLERAGYGKEPLALSEPDLVDKLAEAFEASPWVGQVRIRKTYRRLSITIVYRKPVLCVPWKGKCCYVDATGTVLPPREVKPSVLRNCFVVEGVGETRLPHMGQRFEDPRILAASRLAAFLQPHKELLDLRIVEIRSAKSAALRCDVMTGRKSRILWSRGKGTDEPSESDKLRRLLDYHSRHGGLDQPGGPFEFDLTSLVPTAPVRRPAR